MSEVMRNGVWVFATEPKPEPAKPDPVGDPRRRQHLGGIFLPDSQEDYGNQKKTMAEWCELVATRVTPRCRKTLPEGLYTETEFFDKLETLDIEEYT